MVRETPFRLIFITGTDTGVGKTLFTSLLLQHLRRAGCHALAIKPFCSGGRADAELLHALQDGELTLDEINPFYFPEPLAPLVAARLRQRVISLRTVLTHIESIAARLVSAPVCESKIKNQKSKICHPPTLLIEGSGGLLAPLGESPPGYSALEIVQKLQCEVVLVARNRLGTINHTLLTCRALPSCKSDEPRTFLKHASGINTPKIVLMNHQHQDSSSASNPEIMAELLAPNPVFLIPFLPGKPLHPDHLKKSEKKLKKTLAEILA